MSFKCIHTSSYFASGVQLCISISICISINHIIAQIGVMEINLLNRNANLWKSSNFIIKDFCARMRWLFVRIPKTAVEILFLHHTSHMISNQMLLLVKKAKMTGNSRRMMAATFFNHPLVRTTGKQGGCPVRPSVPITTQRKLKKRMQDKCDPTRKNTWGVKLKQEG